VVLYATPKTPYENINPVIDINPRKSALRDSDKDTMDGLKEENLFCISDGPYLSQLFTEYKLGKSFEPEFAQMGFNKLNSEASSEITRQALLLFVERYLYQHKYCCSSDRGERRVPKCQECNNCRTKETTLWRRVRGVLVCNACALYEKLHNRPRPLNLARRQIKRRNRVVVRRQ
jgi:hypothetical protein